MDSQEKTRLILTAVVSAVVASGIWSAALNYTIASRLESARNSGYNRGYGVAAEEFRMSAIQAGLENDKLRSHLAGIEH